MKSKFNPPYFIAEISANHCGSYLHAKKLIKCAKINGADAVKLQTYTADTMTMKSNKRYFRITDGLWKGYTLWDLYHEAHTPIEWHKKLFKYAKEIGITIFSSPFDETSVDFLESIKCPIYKVASFEMKDLPLLKKICKTGKPIIISTGMATLDEINDTIKFARRHKAKDITILYCVSKYPSENSDFNINNIKILKEKFKCRVGFSDHSLDNNVAKAAIIAGAEVVEKHIALGNQKKGLDIEFSLKGKEIKKFSTEIKDAFKLLGKNTFHRSQNEKKSKIYRRSIFAIRDINKNEKFTSQNIKRIRPGYGIDPKYYEKILNRKSPVKVQAGEPINKSILKKLDI